MKKAMLSQPMAGKTQEEIVATREQAMKALESAGYTIVNTLSRTNGTATKKWSSVELFKFHFAFLQKVWKIWRCVIQRTFARAGKIQGDVSSNTMLQKLMDLKSFTNNVKPGCGTKLHPGFVLK